MADAQGAWNSVLDATQTQLTVKVVGAASGTTTQTEAHGILIRVIDSDSTLRVVRV
jgi:hypothetical protein